MESAVSRKIRVLFVCVHNSARSQMAEAYLNDVAGDMFEAESAGFEVQPINPLAIEAMQEVGLDISQNSVDKVFEFLKVGKRFDYVITVCDAATAQKCPVFPMVKYELHWSFEDPSALEGSHEENMKNVRLIRDAIKAHVEQFITYVESDDFEGKAPKEWKITNNWKRSEDG